MRWPRWRWPRAKRCLVSPLALARACVSIGEEADLVRHRLRAARLDVQVPRHVAVVVVTQRAVGPVVAVDVVEGDLAVVGGAQDLAADAERDSHRRLLLAKTV